MSFKVKDAFKVLAYDEKDKLVADYLFGEMQQAIKFQLGMQKMQSINLIPVPECKMFCFCLKDKEGQYQKF